MFGCALWCLFFTLCAPGWAQFKEIGPPPYSQTVARQKIRGLLATVDSANPQRTIDAVNALAPWYRDLVDQELIAGWQKDTRATLLPVIEPLADAAVAAAVVNYSWRQAPDATFNLTYAPMLGRLMERYPESATGFLADLLAPGASTHPPLTNAQAEAVCRILIDMPDLGNWKKSAQQILPRYRAQAQNVLVRDLNGPDRERAWRAQVWLRELNGDQPGVANQQDSRRKLSAPPPPPTAQAGDPNVTPAPSPRVVNGRPTLARADSAPPAPGAAPAPPPAKPSLFAPPTSGTLKCSGGSVPQNAEYVFSNLPRGNIQLELNDRVWEARLVPDGDGQTQKLILRNISSGPQKKCSVRWSVSP